jgi:glycosyltransferase involved in cell wall biosynthesis
MTTAAAIRPIAAAAREEVVAPAIRVLHVINGEHYAGAERVQDLLAAELGAERVEVSFVCLKAGKFAEARQSRAPLHFIPMRGRFDLRAVWKLVKLVRNGRFDLLHSHGPRSALVASLASTITGVPLVHHVHSPTGNDTTNRLRCRLNALVERFTLRRATALVAVSESLGRQMGERGLAEGKLSVVPNGVPSRKASPGRSDENACWTLGTVALFRPRKGLEVLLCSIAQLRAEGCAVRLRAVGGFETPEYERQIRALASELGLDDAIDWVGFTRDVDSELAQIDLFVLPSLFGEGMPMVVLEAMSAGLPVVSTRVEGIPEVIRDGVDGLIAEPNDADSLCDAIRRFVGGELDAAAFGRHARQRHADRFSARAMATGVAQVYRRVLAC